MTRPKKRMKRRKQTDGDRTYKAFSAYFMQSTHTGIAANLMKKIERQLWVDSFCDRETTYDISNALKDSLRGDV